ncbi:MAG TPA: isoaspartyl peptidase/L-asparaginase [Acidobacteriaceae bacterium]|nr:isoaspartyl peptidase/L-asparaginase [Acidobacteriaceae bacterium]
MTFRASAPCLLMMLCLGACTPALFAQPARAHTTKWAIAIHGGAGEEEWQHMDAATEAAYHASLARALDAGAAVLGKGGRSIDAVEAAIEILEDDPLFNAGRGAAFDAEGKNEMDAAVMDGATLEAGSVAGVSATKNPISLARAVMEHSPYVMMVGPGADAFAVSQHLPQMPPSYFFIEMRWQELLGVLREQGKPIPPRPSGVPAAPQARAVPQSVAPFAHRFGTVGAVARDAHGNVSAGTSTGGMQGKLPGRVGDSPVIGAGTYAANDSCAVSATGVGEYFIRLDAAKEICALVKLKGMSTSAAADQVIRGEVAKLKGGEGGVIVLDQKSDPVWSYNTLGMFRARQVEGGKPEVEVK